jgi:hypothetical protein
MITALLTYITALIIPFDIRDRQKDLPTQRTIPQLLGFKGSKFLALGLVIAAFGLMAIAFPDLIINPFFYGVLLVHIVAVGLVREYTGDHYLAGVIDGLIALLGLLFLL